MKNKFFPFLIGAMILVGGGLLLKDKISGSAAELAQGLPPSPPPVNTNDSDTPMPTTGLDAPPGGTCSTLSARNSRLPTGCGPTWDVRSPRSPLVAQLNCLPGNIENVAAVGDGADSTYIYRKGYQSIRGNCHPI